MALPLRILPSCLALLAGTLYALDGPVPTESGLVQFAKTGNPNGPGLPAWPRYQAAGDQYLEFGDKVEAKSHLHADQLAALERYFARLKHERGK
jgi:hypothetical protein